MGGPVYGCRQKDKSVILNTGSRNLSASIDKVKLYREPIPPERNAVGNVWDMLPQNVDRDADRLNDFLENLDKPLSNGDQQLLPSFTASQLDEIFGPNDTSFSLPDTISADEFVVKIVRPDDPRSQMEDFSEARKAEAAGLIARKIWKVISRSEINKDGMVIDRRFVLTLKNVDTPDEKAKEKYIVQGCSDGDKPYVVHDTSTPRASSIRLILFVSAVMRFRLFFHDVTQAYLQSKYELTRKIYVQPKKMELNIFGLKKVNYLS